MNTKALRQKILDLAIHGKLVPQDPNDEPASALLDRIRAEKERLVKEGKIKRAKKPATSDKSPYGNDAPWELPQGWAWCKIKDIAYFIGGYAFKSSTYIEYSRHQVIRIGNVKNNGLLLDNQPVYVPDAIAEEAKDYRLSQGDILFTMTGTKGKRDYFFTCEVPITSNSLYLNQRVGCLRLVGLIERQYLLLALKHNVVLDAIFATETGNVSQGNIGSENTLNLLIPLPPLAEQKRIVAEVERLNSLVDIVEQNQADLTTTISQAKAKILDLAIHGKLVPQDPTDEPAEVLLKRINPKWQPSDNPHYEQMPKGWANAVMDDVCKITDAPSVAGEDLPYLDVKYLRGKGEAKMETKGKLVSEGCKLILVDGENSGEVFVVPHRGYQGSTFKQLEISSQMLDEYVLLIILANQKLLKENKVGSAIPHLNKKLFRALNISIPPINEQRRIVKSYNLYTTLLDRILSDC